MAEKVPFWKKLLKGVLIGGGTILSALCPAAGGAVVTAGMKIGAGAVAAGELIKTDTPMVSLDNLTNSVTGWLASMGLTKPVTSNSITGGFALTTNAWLLILAVVAAIFLIFKRGRR